MNDEMVNEWKRKLDLIVVLGSADVSLMKQSIC